VRVRWLPSATANLVEIGNYIARDNPVAAEAIYVAIRRRVANLADLPNIGRPGRRKGTRELVISGTPYIVVYRVARRVVTILRVLHGAQRWP
jgi:toxin ParE1/3/4